MSRRVRNRVTATVLGGFLLGAAVVTTGTASADQVAGGGRQVVFAGGGVLGISCSSTPSAEAMSVPAHGRVTLVNRTGHEARLLLNGESKGSIPDDGATEVVFRHGATAVSLEPSCAVTDQATPVLVTAAPPPPVQPGPTPGPLDPNASGSPSTPTGSETPGEPADSGGALPDPIPTVTRPQLPSTTAPAPTTTRPTPRATRVPVRSVTTHARSRPRGDAVSRVKTKTTRGTARAVAPAFTGMPPGEGKTILSGVPPLDLTPTPAESDPPAGLSSDVVAAEPVAAMRPMPESQPVGLLAVIAIVSVLGVAIGAIRAFVSQRASRASLA